MKLNELKKLEKYKKAVKLIRTKEFQDAINTLKSIYTTLPTDGQENTICRIFLKIEMAKICSKNSVEHIAEQLTASTSSRETPLSLEAYNSIKQEVETALSSSDLSNDNVKKLQEKLNAVKLDLSNSLIRKAEEIIIHQFHKDHSAVKKALEEIEDFYRHYQGYLASSHAKYMVRVMVSISESLARKIMELPTREDKLASLRFIITLFTQAQELAGENALVQSAEICFEKWNAYKQFAALSSDNKKRVAYQFLVNEFKGVFGEHLVESCPHYHERSTQYAYSISYAHHALLELAKLSDDAEVKANHLAKAAELKAEFVKLSENGCIHIEELPKSHQHAMLVAQSTLAPLQERQRIESSYADLGTSSEEESEEKSESDSDADLDAQFKAFQQVMMRRRAQNNAISTSIHLTNMLLTSSSSSSSLSITSSSIAVSSSSASSSLPFSSSFRLASMTATTTTTPTRIIDEENGKRRKI